MSISLRDRALPAWINDKLTQPPTAGAGVHFWLFGMACALKPWREPEEVARLLSAAVVNCGRSVSPKEIQDAINHARNDWSPDGFTPGSSTPLILAKDTTHTWPKPDFEAIARVAAAGQGLVDLWGASPLQLDGSQPAEDFIDALFPGNPWLCFAKAEPTDAITKRRRVWREINAKDHAFVVPSEMSAETGVTQDGKHSLRSLSNTGPRQYLVVEFDFEPEPGGSDKTPVKDLLAALAGQRSPRTAPDLCAGLLLHLVARGAPLALAVHSGGKSVHGWFPTFGASDAQLRPFFNAACRLGADPATWVRCQLVRMPEGTRADGRRQRVFYCNPAVLPAATQPLSSR